ncbi:hypothetical protein [Marinobacterium arenosum]|uniref:hypothetical protein n=1 Tax=Marinobacterium arenosum TaxID=2862496 RepID=UPI001C96D9CD|nr:hypothetical protein [Marinobacterium arenosum]MBY4675735.1 hypothetical protein [Marinobacterium arenosum]
MHNVGFFNKGLLLAALIVGIGGCSYGNAPGPQAGTAVQELEQHQRVNPVPPEYAKAPVMDGLKAQNVVNQYRAETGNQQQINNEIHLNIGN